MSEQSERLAQIRQRTKEATPGPWRYDEICEGVMAPFSEGIKAIVEADTTTDEAPDLLFIAEARQDIPWLLELISDLQDENKAWREADRVAKEGVLDSAMKSEEPEEERFPSLAACVAACRLIAPDHIARRFNALTAEEVREIMRGPSQVKP